ncbi:hypothetical protein [Methylomonas koyamae]|uniref:hypothetical protein n=1 Tax=Methylomonas koyamae TaxID=702114 RepID=UPI0012F6865F|nr:hypothetical protein [Methylomonas koyamae]
MRISVALKLKKGLGLQRKKRARLLAWLSETVSINGKRGLRKIDAMTLRHCRLANDCCFSNSGAALAVAGQTIGRVFDAFAVLPHPIKASGSRHAMWLTGLA